jgi:hypothetical protein
MMEIKKQYAYFSAAIRDGALKFPEVYGPYFKHDAKGNICGACAIGAGLAMCGLPGNSAELQQAFPYMAAAVRCPEGDSHQGENDLIGICILLFEFHRWTREAIADWLYTEEEKLGFVTLIETEALKTPEAGSGDNNVAEAQAGVLT